MAPNLLSSLINASEKASNIARMCRSNEQLLELLIQEKTGKEANLRFQHDFKTLADVLIQETIKHDIGKSFPEMKEDAIKGEESPNFTNAEGVTISITVGDSIDDTVECLSAIIQGEAYEDAIRALAQEVHKTTEYTAHDLGLLPELPTSLNYENLGIWIDPIDATAEYISGINKASSLENIAAAGLDCVTVLIGVYERDSGIPVLGVISQPFHLNNNCFQSKVFWGVALPDLKTHNIFDIKMHQKPIGIFSSSEQAKLLNIFEEAGYEIIFSAGAGHKALKVVSNDADIYVLSKHSTFKWDTCAPQAILRALDGNMFSFVDSIQQKLPIPINYLENSEIEKCNNGGILAVRDLLVLETMLPKLIEVFEYKMVKD